MSESPRNTVPNRGLTTGIEILVLVYSLEHDVHRPGSERAWGNRSVKGLGINSAFPLAPSRGGRVNPDPHPVESARWPALPHRWRPASHGRGPEHFQSRPAGRISPFPRCCLLSTLG